MSEEAETGGFKGPVKPKPSAPEPVKPRRGILGYKRTDVDRMLAERDALLAETRQDVAALWLAFAQHDRMIRQGLDRVSSIDPHRAQPAPAPPAPMTRASPAAPMSPREQMRAPAPEPSAPEVDESVDQQLSDLDEVLAAIEAATQTLEQAYADEIAPEPRDGGPEKSAGDQPAGTEPGSSSSSSASSPA